MSEHMGEPGAGRLVAGRYRVVERLGRGGMGTVWRAVDETLRREVAVKELRSFNDADPRDLAAQRLRMEREARAAARVRHPHVVGVYDVTEHEGRPVIVMELVDGPSLGGLLQEHGAMEPVPAARIGAQVMDALAAAHAAGVLHRDVKPGNILLERSGRVVLTDFGIAAMEEPDDGASTRLTRSGEVIGSLDYLAPERAQGGEPGAAADVWALGATLYAAVEGVSPFRRTSTWSTITAIVSDPLPPPRRAGPLAPALAELLEKDPALRADAVRAAELLHAVAEGRALPPGSPETVRLRAHPGPGPAPLGRFGPPPGPAGADTPASPVSPTPTPTPTTPPARLAAEADTVRRGTGKRRRAVVAGAVAAVLLAGAGVTYLLAGGDDPGGRRGTEAADPARPGGRTSPDGSASAHPSATGGASAGQPGPRPSRSRSGSVSATPSATASKSPSGVSSPSGTSSPGHGGGDPGGSASPGVSCGRTGGGKYTCEVWRDATSYDAGHRAVGTLHQGTNYFYCQKKLPQRETFGKWTNIWWARTDDDSGNANVYVSDVYLKGGDNDRPVPGLPEC
jgi:serine/threonine protein kinase